jgi:hypothetical protein
MAELTDVRETVRETYAVAAKAASATTEAGCCGLESLTSSPADADGVFGATLYRDAAGEEVPQPAIIGARKPAADGCCEPQALTSCCEPQHKDDCCGAPSASAPLSCGCQS